MKIDKLLKGNYLHAIIIALISLSCSDVWDPVISYFANITKTAGNLQIVFGPIFDHDGDGLQDNFTR